MDASMEPWTTSAFSGVVEREPHRPRVVWLLKKPDVYETRACENMNVRNFASKLSRQTR